MLDSRFQIETGNQNNMREREVYDMTVYEKIREVLRGAVDGYEEDSVKQLVFMAYWVGHEEGAKRELDQHNKLAQEQKKRAGECR